MISFKNYNDVLSSAESKLFPYCTIALDQFLWCVVGIYTLSQVCIILLCFIVFVTEHHLVFSLLVEILFWWWTCASLTDYKGGGLKNSLISRQFLFLFFLISLVPYYDTNQCFWVHWTSIPKFTTPTKKIQFLAFLLWNWMMRLLYSQHISDKIGWPASIQSFHFLIPLDFSLWNKQFQIETDESKL